MSVSDPGCPEYFEKLLVELVDVAMLAPDREQLDRLFRLAYRRGEHDEYMRMLEKRYGKRENIHG